MSSKDDSNSGKKPEKPKEPEKPENKSEVEDQLWFGEVDSSAPGINEQTKPKPRKPREPTTLEVANSTVVEDAPAKFGLAALVAYKLGQSASQYASQTTIPEMLDKSKPNIPLVHEEASRAAGQVMREVKKSWDSKRGGPKK